MCPPVNFAILKAHRLGEPRVLELTRVQLAELRRHAGPGEFTAGPPATYRGLRVAETAVTPGRVLAWDRARETEVVQPIDWAVRERRP
ncbi:hypothetical protein [Phenylobacterium sp.]|jgi:hypothetical protein|uniref:hypothetical protein n=1 Tax=Phenylobacterium sp. TaxID=1871053 RepID=UPI002F9404E2